MKAKKFLCSLIAGSMLMTSSVSASGIPVVDGASIAQDIALWTKDMVETAKDYTEQTAQTVAEIAQQVEQARQWVADKKVQVMNYMEELGLVEIIGQIQELKDYYDEINSAVMNVHSAAMKDYKNAKNTLEGLMDGDLDPFIKQITGGVNGKIACDKDSKYSDNKNNDSLVASSERRYTFCMNRLSTHANILHTFDNTQKKINALRDKMREVYEDAAKNSAIDFGGGVGTSQGQADSKIHQRAVQIAYLQNEINSEMKLAEIELAKQRVEFEMAQAKYQAEVKSNQAIEKFINK